MPAAAVRAAAGGKNLTSTLATASASLLPQAKNFTLRSNASCRMKSGASRWFAESQTNTARQGCACALRRTTSQPRNQKLSTSTNTVRRMYREARSVVNQGGGEGVDLCPRLSRRPLICRRDCPRDAAFTINEGPPPPAPPINTDNARFCRGLPP